jgi:hypothetical protein
VRQDEPPRGAKGVSLIMSLPSALSSALSSALAIPYQTADGAAYLKVGIFSQSLDHIDAPGIEVFTAQREKRFAWVKVGAEVTVL